MTQESMFMNLHKHCNMHARCWMSLTVPSVAWDFMPATARGSARTVQGEAFPRCNIPTGACATSNIAHFK